MAEMNIGANIRTLAILTILLIAVSDLILVYDWHSGFPIIKGECCGKVTTLLQNINNIVTKTLRALTFYNTCGSQPKTEGLTSGASSLKGGRVIRY
ncbi:MAG: hypothetical protein K2G05_04880 [Duncaniella sp.]|nr:hypothetical protein [Duncaniella sp.]